jgi:protocatechuate 3,4-dioxygenase beta subunit
MRYCFIFLTIWTTAPLMAQSAGRVGGPCEDCQLIYQDQPRQLNAADTSAGWYDKGRRFVLSGRAFRADGLTPAANVVIYYWHTDARGLYSPKGSQRSRHGHLRGWVKTDAQGRYRIYTSKPQPYPNERIPAHVHFLIKEPNIKNEYYPDDVVFDEDPLVNTAFRRTLESRCGSGVIYTEIRDGVLYGTRDFYLGVNVPNYPHPPSKALVSGLAIGSNCPAFDPTHVWGADKGTHACPMCKYGMRSEGLIVWLNDHPSSIGQWLKSLDGAFLAANPQQRKAFVIYTNPDGTPPTEVAAMLQRLARDLQLKHVALAHVPSPTDSETAALYQINPQAKTTVLVYRKRLVVNKLVNIGTQVPSVEKLFPKL